MLQVGGTPRAVQIVRGHNARLDVRPRAHFLGRAKQDANLTAPHLCEQFRFLGFRVGVVNERDFLFRDAPCNQLAFNIVIDVELAVVVGRREVAEHQLRSENGRAVPPDVEHILHAGVDFAVRVIRQERIHQTLVKRQFSPVPGYSQHIVRSGVNVAGSDGVGASAQILNHFPLELAGFRLNHNVFGFRDGQFQHIRSLDVGGFLPYADKFRQIIEAGEARLGAESAPFRLQFHRRDLLSEVSRPVIEMLVSVTLQRIVLQIAHHRIQLNH